MRTEIERLAGQQAVLQDQVALATVHVSLYEAGASVAKTQPGERGSAFGDSVHSAWHATVAVVGGWSSCSAPCCRSWWWLTLEAAVPLLISVVSAAAGLLGPALFLRAQLDQTLQPPGLSYYLLMIGGVIASLAIIASTLPILGRVTGPDTARND